MAKEPEPVEDLPSPKDAATPDVAAKGGKLSTLIPIATILVAIPLVMVLMWEFYMMPSLKKLARQQGGGEPVAAEVAKAEESEAAPAKEEKSGKGGKEGEAAANPTFELKDIVANLSGAMRSRYIKVSFTLEGKSPTFPETMKANEAKIRDATLAVLSDLTIQDLEEPGVKNIVRNNIVDAINQALRGSEVQQLYFSEFVVQ
jgi:flagellar protein FliL